MKTLTICPNCNNGIRADGIMGCNACGGHGKIEIDTGDGVSDNVPAYECCDLCEGSGWVGDCGPGMEGNAEFVPCECEANTEASRDEGGERL